MAYTAKAPRYWIKAELRTKLSKAGIIVRGIVCNEVTKLWSKAKVKDNGSYCLSYIST